MIDEFTPDRGNKLTDRQRAVLDFICASIQDRGYPPTLREIGNKLGIRSTNGVNDHLRALERKGFLTREDMKSRTLRPTASTTALLSGTEGAAANGRGGPNGYPSASLPHVAFGEAANDDLVEIPIVGRVAAGPLTAAFEHRTDTVRIDRMLLGGRSGGEVFGLKISGESMIEAGIHDGDYVFVRKQPEAPRGAIVIAMHGEDATCKFYYPEGGHIRLQPANSAMAPILIPRSEWNETQILGVVVGVYRKI